MADQQNQMSQNFVSTPNYGAPPNQPYGSGPPPMPGVAPQYGMGPKVAGMPQGQGMPPPPGMYGAPQGQSMPPGSGMPPRPPMLVQQRPGMPQGQMGVRQGMPQGHTMPNMPPGPPGQFRPQFRPPGPPGSAGTNTPPMTGPSRPPLVNGPPNSRPVGPPHAGQPFTGQPAASAGQPMPPHSSGPAPPHQWGPPTSQYGLGVPPALPRNLSAPSISQSSGMVNGLPVQQSYTPPPTGKPQINGQQPGMQGPPQKGMVPPPMITTPPQSSVPSSNAGLPIPFQGHGQYSHQLHTNNVGHHQPITPTNSEPASQRSSRDPSPIPYQQVDALEGQFSPQSPQSAGDPSQGQGFPTPPRTNGVSGAPSVPTSSAPTSVPHAPSGIVGRRQYPQMVYNQPSFTPPPGGQPGHMPQAPAPPGQYPSPPGQMAAGQPGAPGAIPTGPPSSYPNNVMPGQMPVNSMPGQMQVNSMPGQMPVNSMPGQMPVNSMPGQMPGYPQMNQQQGYMANNVHPSNALNSTFNNLKIQAPADRCINLLQERRILPEEGVETVKPNVPQDYKKVNCSSEIFRCTLTSLPHTQALLNKSRLPLGILIHPFRDLSQLPVIQSSVIVRCRSCRTYINPYVTFVDMRRWKCNLCFRVNELPEEFNFDPVSRTYGEPQRRPEIRSSTIEFIAPSEYMLRPPQPAVYLYLLDVSFNAVSTGYLKIFCQTLIEELERVPGDSRTQIGFITFDSALHFYNLAEGLSQPQMMVVSDIEDVFLPCPDNLLVNFHESRDLVLDLLSRLPEMFEKNMETSNCLGAALQAIYKMMSPTGGRVTVMQTLLPTVGPGALKNREDPNERAGKNVQNLGPATDYYKKLALDCSAQQIAVDLFLLNSQYADIASVACISKFSGGSLNYFPGLNPNNHSECDRFESSLRRYFTRKIGFESVMRIRCTRGLSIHTFHGNFFVRSTDLLSLPNVNPDAGYGMQISIEDTIESNTVTFQAALLYTSSKGERRIRVHTLCMPVTNSLSEIYAGADQQAVIGLLAKMAVDKSITQSMPDARDAMINAAVDMVQAYGSHLLTASQRLGQLPVPFSLRLMPLYILALVKHVAFRTGTSTRLDSRVFALEQFKTQPLPYLIMEIYPNLYPVHGLDERKAILKDDTSIPQPPLLQLSSANIDRHGVYLLDTGSRMMLWVGGAISDHFCQEVFDVPNFASVPDLQSELPELETETSDKLRSFISYLNDQRPFPAAFNVIREDSRSRMHFLQHMLEDRTDSSMSYYEFLQHLQKEVKS